jgi:hypothetical protein
MRITFPSAPRQLGIIKQLRDLAREEVGKAELVRLDRAQTRIHEHSRRADQAYTDFAAFPRVA